MPEPRAPRVLVVEDEFLIASALRLQLEQQGAHVLGPVARVATALEVIADSERIDCAVLDVKLADEPVFPVVEALLARGVRFAFMTCYDPSALPAAYRDAVCFSKLEDPRVLIRWVLGS